MEAQKRYENLAATISTHLALLVTVVLGYCWIAFNEHRRLQAVSHLPSIDLLLGVRNLALKSPPQVRPLLYKDLPLFSVKARAEAGAPTSDGRDPYYEEIQNQRGFGQLPIPNVALANAKSRVSQRYCYLAVATGLPGKKFNFATFELMGKTYWGKSENTKVVLPDKCFSILDQQHEFIAIVETDGDIVIGLPKRLQVVFPPIALPPPLSSFTLDSSDEIAAVLPEPIRKYISGSFPIVTIRLDAIEHSILSYASYRLGQKFGPDEFDDAMKLLFAEQEPNANLFGFNASLSTLIQFGPFMTFFLCLDLWRRVIAIKNMRTTSQVFWFATDTEDRIGKFIAYSFALIPLVGTIAVLIGFALAARPTLLGWHDIRLMLSLLKMGAPISSISFWVPISAAASILVLLFPMQVTLAFFTTQAMLEVIARNLVNDHTPRLNRWRYSPVRKKGTKLGKTRKKQKSV